MCGYITGITIFCNLNCYGLKRIGMNSVKILIAVVYFAMVTCAASKVKDKLEKGHHPYYVRPKPSKTSNLHCPARCLGAQVGPIGPQGAQGLPGVIGIQGIQGVPGVQGVQGQTGIQGERGFKGDTGQKGRRGFKGKKGDTGYSRPPPPPTTPSHVAFSVTMNENVPAVNTELNRVLRFNIIITNIGLGYDDTTGYFTAPYNATYFFGFSGVSYDGQNVLLHLVKKTGERILSAYDNSGCKCCHGSTHAPKDADWKCAGSGGNAGILILEEGDSVCIVLADNYGLHNALYHHYATFYGHLLFPYTKFQNIEKIRDGK